jgi:large subunit ribosomal protein L3
MSASTGANKGILGKKLGMTQIIGENGVAIPVTVIQAGPCVVAGKRSKERDGYESLQLGLGEKKASRVTKPVAGIFKKQGVSVPVVVREVAFANCDSYEVGQTIAADVFAEGEKVDVVGVSKGKGFQGTMKRHRFGGGPRSHGSMTHRQPASSGSTDAARTLRGTRKPGHMGSVQVTAQGLVVVKVDTPRSLILVRGAVPGPTNSVVVIKNSVKA